MINFVYKILTLNEWIIFQRDKTILSNFDQFSGFIHLSTKKQIKETITLTELNFSRTNELIIGDNT